MNHITTTKKKHDTSGDFDPEVENNSFINQQCLVFYRWTDVGKFSALHFVIQVGFCTDPAYYRSCCTSLLTILMGHVDPASHIHYTCWDCNDLAWFSACIRWEKTWWKGSHQVSLRPHLLCPIFCVALISFCLWKRAKTNYLSSYFTPFSGLLFFHFTATGVCCYRATASTTFVKALFIYLFYLLLFFVSDHD